MVDFDQTTSGAFGGVISGTGSLDKDDSATNDAGNVTLTAAQTYTGATYVEAGTLTLGAVNAIADSSGATLGRVGGGATATLALERRQYFGQPVEQCVEHHFGRAQRQCPDA